MEYPSTDEIWSNLILIDTYSGEAIKPGSEFHTISRLILRSMSLSDEFPMSPHRSDIV